MAHPHEPTEEVTVQHVNEWLAQERGRNLRLEATERRRARREPSPLARFRARRAHPDR